MLPDGAALVPLRPTRYHQVADRKREQMPGEIDLERVEAIKAMVERSLPPSVLATLQQAGMSLALSSSSHAVFQPDEMSDISDI